jgi:LacI family transcriptional regulator
MPRAGLRPSIRDVAARAGVSHTTVSLALRNDPRITRTVRRRVQRFATELGYHPHAAVSELIAQLRTLKFKAETATLGFITAWPTRDGWRDSPDHGRFFSGAERHARELGYKVEPFWLREPGMTSRRMSQILRIRGIRGLILQSLPRAHGHLSLEWRHFAAVAEGLTITRPRLHRVISSHFGDMRLVVHHLKHHDYRRLGLVLSAELDARVDRAWLGAYLLHQHELSPGEQVPALILASNREQAQFEEWFTRHRPEVVLFTALPVPCWVDSLGLRVPADVGLVHLDWSEECRALAGIHANAEKIGAVAVDLLVDQLHANEFGIPSHEKTVSVSGRWVPGASLRPAHGHRQD